jgi:hypothetical protein
MKGVFMNTFLNNGQLMSPNGYNLGYTMSGMTIHSPIQPFQPLYTVQPNNYYATLQERYTSIDFWRGGWELPRQTLFRPYGSC